MQNNKSKVYSLRLPDELRSKLEERAKKEGRTLSNLTDIIQDLLVGQTEKLQLLKLILLQC